MRSGSELHIISIASSGDASREFLVTFMANRWPSNSSEEPAAGAFRGRSFRSNGNDYMELKRLSGFADPKTGGGWRRMVVRYELATTDGSGCFSFMDAGAVRAAITAREIEGREIGGQQVPERRVLISSPQPVVRALLAKRGKELFHECAGSGNDRWNRLP